ncbi:MAG TPA: hypothetical protein VKY74_22550, partial [Chloroflexia bacterium]|nr:hypothetical protein [Chloroflexia bacterium]
MTRSRSLLALILTLGALALLGSRWPPAPPAATAAAIPGRGAAPASLPPGAPRPGVPNPGFTMDYLERTGNVITGTHTDTGDIVYLPAPVGSGYLVVMDDLSADPNDEANWSDVLHFIDDGWGMAEFAQLLSVGATFPTTTTVNAAPHGYIQELLTGVGDDDLDVTIYDAGGGTLHRIHSASPPPRSPTPGTPLPSPTPGTPLPSPTAP